MGTFMIQISEDETQAEKQAIRKLTDAYSLTKAWKGDGDERAEIERDIRNVQKPIAFGLSPEFAKWEMKAMSAGVVWTLDDYGYLTVRY